MAPTDPPSQSRRKRIWFRLAAAIFLVVVVYILGTAIAVVSHARKDETREADAIIVFGAAEYAGKPSPIYRARLEHALTLFQRGIAPIVITTGGAGKDSAFTEGQVGRDFLLARGIPERQLIAETQSKDTQQSAQRVANIMRANGMKSCVAVSDGYHLYRIKSMLAREGVKVYGTPRPETRPGSLSKRLSAITHEVVSYTLWKVYFN
jgi:uncharacterized SAM-binding protein YcdF (DUF218 family)